MFHSGSSAPTWRGSSPGSGAACVYTWNGLTSCLIGVWVNRFHGVTIEQLEHYINAERSGFPDRVEEWETYLFFLRQHAAIDGTLPASFDSLRYLIRREAEFASYPRGYRPCSHVLSSAGA